MSKQLSRKEFMRRFGAEQVNDVWAWCAVNHADKICYFSAWVDQAATDEQGAKYYTLQRSWWGKGDHSNSALGRKDHDEKFDLVFNHGYSARMYFVVAEDTTAQPRSIKETRTSFVFDAELVRTDDEIRGYPKARIETPRR